MSLTTAAVGALAGGIGATAATVAAGAAVAAWRDARLSRRVLVGEDGIESDGGLVEEVEDVREIADEAARAAGRANRRLDETGAAS